MIISARLSETLIPHPAVNQRTPSQKRRTLIIKSGGVVNARSLHRGAVKQLISACALGLSYLTGEYDIAGVVAPLISVPFMLIFLGKGIQVREER